MYSGRYIVLLKSKLFTPAIINQIYIFIPLCSTFTSSYSCLLFWSQHILGNICGLCPWCYIFYSFTTVVVGYHIQIAHMLPLKSFGMSHLLIRHLVYVPIIPSYFSLVIRILNSFAHSPIHISYTSGFLMIRCAACLTLLFCGHSPFESQVEFAYPHVFLNASKIGYSLIISES